MSTIEVTTIGANLVSQAIANAWQCWRNLSSTERKNSIWVRKLRGYTSIEKLVFCQQISLHNKGHTPCFLHLCWSDVNLLVNFQIHDEGSEMAHIWFIDILWYSVLVLPKSSLVWFSEEREPWVEPLWMRSERSSLGLNPRTSHFN